MATVFRQAEGSWRTARCFARGLGAGLAFLPGHVCTEPNKPPSPREDSKRAAPALSHDLSGVDASIRRVMCQEARA